MWEGTDGNTFYGVYPYDAEYDSFKIPTDQSGGVQDADWMTDDFTDNKSVGNVQFDFQHRLAKVTVNITKWNSEFDGTEQITNPKIYSKGTDVTAVYENGGATITATGDITEIDPFVDGTSYTAIVAPAEYTITDKFMTFKVGEQEMTILAKTDTLTGGLEPGNHYTFNLTVGKDAVEITEVTVNGWKEETIDAGTAKETDPKLEINFTETEVATGRYEINNLTVATVCDMVFECRNEDQSSPGTSHMAAALDYEIRISAVYTDAEGALQTLDDTGWIDENTPEPDNEGDFETATLSVTQDMLTQVGAQSYSLVVEVRSTVFPLTPMEVLGEIIRVKGSVTE